jgi:hypothetical protein
MRYEANTTRIMFKVGGIQTGVTITNHNYYLINNDEKIIRLAATVVKKTIKQIYLIFAKNPIAVEKIPR